MIVLIAISVGIREQNVLACLFMLIWTTMYLGLLTELYSRPVIQRDQTNYQTPLGRLGFFEKADYTRNPNALHLLSQSHWEGERRVLRDQDGKPVPNQPIEYIHAQRCPTTCTVWYHVRAQSIDRTHPLPPLFAVVLLTCSTHRRALRHSRDISLATAMVVIVYHLEYQKWELRQNTDLEIPWFVNAVLYGSLILFSSLQWCSRCDLCTSTHAISKPQNT